jgi:hypothetical protein
MFIVDGANVQVRNGSMKSLAWDVVKLPLVGSVRISMSEGLTGFFQGKSIRAKVCDITLKKYIYIIKEDFLLIFCAG